MNIKALDVSPQLLAMRREMSTSLNRKLDEIFALIEYETPFMMRIAMHAIERISERITEHGHARQLGQLFKRIVSHGICELLYFQTRYASGDTSVKVEFKLDDLIAPIMFDGDYVVIRTVFVQDPNLPRDNMVQIDLSDK